MTITVTDETKGTYYAYFSEPEEKVYCRIRNKGTGKFLSVSGDTPATPTTQTMGDQSATDGYKFTNSLKMISAEEDPTGISIMHNDECIMHHAPSAVYDLQGRKLADNPSSLISHPSSKPGIYIHKGKKIIIK